MIDSHLAAAVSNAACWVAVRLLSGKLTSIWNPGDVAASGVVALAPAGASCRAGRVNVPVARVSPLVASDRLNTVAFDAAGLDTGTHGARDSTWPLSARLDAVAPSSSWRPG